MKWLVILNSETDNSEIIGRAGVFFRKEEAPDYKENKHISSFWIAILPNFRRKYIASKLLKMIIDVAKSKQITLLECWTSNADGWSFLEQFGEKVKLVMDENRAYIKDIDLSLMEE